MIDESELPTSIVKRATMMESILTAAATEGSDDNHIYVHLRREFIQNEKLKDILPIHRMLFRHH